MEMLFSGKAVEIDRMVSGDKHYTEDFVRWFNEIGEQLKVDNSSEYVREMYNLLHAYVLMMNYHWANSEEPEIAVYRLAKHAVMSIRDTEYMLRVKDEE